MTVVQTRPGHEGWAMTTLEAHEDLVRSSKAGSSQADGSISVVDLTPVLASEVHERQVASVS